MKAARYYGKADIRVDDVDEPQPGEGEVLVDVEWCKFLQLRISTMTLIHCATGGICGSDLHEYAVGPTSLPAPEDPAKHVVQTLGHELCGRVRSPPAGSKFKDGDAVMVDPRVLCHACLPCKSGSSHCCNNLGYIGGSTGFGGFGEKVVANEEYLYLLPPEIPLEHAAVLEPLVIVQHAIKVSGIKDFKDRDVLVLGGGPIGFALLLCLKAAGANKVVVSEPASARRNQVAEFCQAVINPFEESVENRCEELTDGKGVEIVFDCAGVPRALEGAINAIRFEGLYVMVAVWEQPVSINAAEAQLLTQADHHSMLEIPQEAHHNEGYTHFR